MRFGGLLQSVVHLPVESFRTRQRYSRRCVRLLASAHPGHSTHLSSSLRHHMYRGKVFHTSCAGVDCGLLCEGRRYLNSCKSTWDVAAGSRPQQCLSSFQTAWVQFSASAREGKRQTQIQKGFSHRQSSAKWQLSPTRPVSSPVRYSSSLVITSKKTLKMF